MTINYFVYFDKILMYMNLFPIVFTKIFIHYNFGKIFKSVIEFILKLPSYINKLILIDIIYILEFLTVKI